MRDLTSEELRLLAQQERGMDRGEVPFVVMDGMRVAMQQQALEELGLESGQTVSRAFLGPILHANMAAIEAQHAVRQAQKAAHEKGDSP